jgi:hypothetical protein
VIPHQALSQQPYIIESDGHWGILKFVSFNADNSFTASVFGETAQGRFDNTERNFSFAAAGKIWLCSLPRDNNFKLLGGNTLIFDPTNGSSPISYVGSWRAATLWAVQLLSHHGQFIVNDAPHDGDLMCNLPPETSISDGDYPFLRKALQLQANTDETVSLANPVTRQFISADQGGGGRVTIDRSVARIWEKFRIHNTGDNRIGLQCALTGFFLTAEYADDISQRKVVAGGHGRVPGDMNTWETFVIEDATFFLT